MQEQAGSNLQQQRSNVQQGTSNLQQSTSPGVSSETSNILYNPPARQNLQVQSEGVSRTEPAQLSSPSGGFEFTMLLPIIAVVLLVALFISVFRSQVVQEIEEIELLVEPVNTVPSPVRKKSTKKNQPKRKRKR